MEGWTLVPTYGRMDLTVHVQPTYIIYSLSGPSVIGDDSVWSSPPLQCRQINHYLHYA